LPSKEALRLGGWKLWLFIGVVAAVIIGGAILAAMLLAPKPGAPGGGAPAPGQGPAPSPPSAGTHPPSAPPPGTGPVQPAPPGPTPPTPPPPNLDEPAQAALKVAKEFEAQPDTPPEEAIRVYQETVIDVYPKTQAAEEARQAIERLRKKEGGGTPPAAPETPEKAPADTSASDRSDSP
jgi:hypothetical protein